MRLAATTIRTMFIIAPLVFGYGCASSAAPKGPDPTQQALTSSQSALAEAKAARTTAEAALAEARAANAKMDQVLAQTRGAPVSREMMQQVLDAARAAQAAAEDAKRMAMQAQESADRLDAKTDRMFEKSMRK